MFKSTDGLFSQIPCPSTNIPGETCSLPNCIFLHENIIKRPNSQDLERKVSDRKRIKVERVEKVEKGGNYFEQPSNSSQVLSGNIKSLNKVEISSDESNVKLTPRPVLPFNPASLQQRVQFLKLIHQELVKTKTTTTPKTEAVEAEFTAASKSSTTTYPVNIRKLVADIKSGSFKNKEALEQQAKKDADKIRDEELQKLVVSLDMLKLRKYVTSPISSSEIPPNFMANCARCGVLFDITKNTRNTCTFHLLRRDYDPSKGKRSDIFPCCSQPLGESNGCQQRDFHVWKFDDPALMASVIPFAKTPSAETDKTLFSAGIDCEMGYTSFGMELIRVTVVDWRTNKTVLDRCVFPYGDILDLNTRFSGISKLEDGITNDDGTTKYPTITFKQARELLFQLISSSTILVGHGLENDMNALRIIHHNIVDTAIIYPSIREPRTYSLKQLTFKYLGKLIQLGEHDSSEDALAAMDIVKENIKISLKTKQKLLA